MKRLLSFCIALSSLAAFASPCSWELARHAPSVWAHKIDTSIQAFKEESFWPARAAKELGAAIEKRLALSDDQASPVVTVNRLIHVQAQILEFLAIVPMMARREISMPFSVPVLTELDGGTGVREVSFQSSELFAHAFVSELKKHIEVGTSLAPQFLRLFRDPLYFQNVSNIYRTRVQRAVGRPLSENQVDTVLDIFTYFERHAIAGRVSGLSAKPGNWTESQELIIEQMLRDQGYFSEEELKYLLSEFSPRPALILNPAKLSLIRSKLEGDRNWLSAAQSVSDEWALAALESNLLVTQLHRIALDYYGHSEYSGRWGTIEQLLTPLIRVTEYLTCWHAAGLSVVTDGKLRHRAIAQMQMPNSEGKDAWQMSEFQRKEAYIAFQLKWGTRFIESEVSEEVATDYEERAHLILSQRRVGLYPRFLIEQMVLARKALGASYTEEFGMVLNLVERLLETRYGRR